MMYHLRRVSDLLCNWKSCLLCYMKDVVLHCSIFFKWNKLVRVRVRVRVRAAFGARTACSGSRQRKHQSWLFMRRSYRWIPIRKGQYAKILAMIHGAWTAWLLIYWNILLDYIVSSTYLFSVRTLFYAHLRCCIICHYCMFYGRLRFIVF